MSVQHQEKFFSEEELPWIVKEGVMPLLDRGVRVMLLYGPMGVGKTALVREVAYQLGVKGAVKSPTFGYVNIYQLKPPLRDGISLLCHFDLYRLTAEDGLIGSELDECIANPGALVMVEWPGLVEGLVLQKGFEGVVCKIKLGYGDHYKGKRKILIESS